ncbi:hypothetical protein PsYK624_108570 [Phanerochaete sordida]|uniref:Uncharacterized protein n=1 Tax=Phanerochaete sordida TaxID=48140 RepID=A0A9P3GGU5_9APHY|nr:hypothetical protein PsYK624_108570 [Phanerochaete sordida]
MASRSSTPRPKDMSRSSTPRPEVTITIPTVPSASSAAAEAVAGVLPQLLASSTASAGAAAPSGGAPLVAAPDPKVPTGDALKPEQQEALPAAVGQDKKAEGSGESTAEGANKPAAVEGAPALEAVDAPKEAGEKATDVVPASVPPAAEASPSEDAGGETKPEGQATEPAAPAATPSADPEAEKTVEVPPEKPVEQEVARAGAGEDTVKDAPKEAEPGTKTESISKAEEELSKDTVTAGEAPQPEAVSTDGKSSEPTTPTAHPTPAFTYNLGNFPKPPAPPSETYTSDAWDDYLDAHEHPEEHDLSGEPIIVTHEDAVGAGALTPTVEAEQKDAIGADAVLVQPEDAVKTPVTPQNDGADIQAASVVEGNTSSSLSEKKESTSTENLAENPSVTGDAATVPVAVDQPSSETKETEAKVETTPAAAPTSKEPETGTVPEAPATKTDESKPEPAVAEEASASKPGEAKEEAEQEAESTEPKTSEAASTASTAQPSVDDKTKVAESQSETAKDKALPEALAEIAAADADIGPAPITTPPPVAVTSPAAKPDDAQKPKSGTATTLTTDSPSSGPRSAVPPPTPSKAMNATASTFVPQSPSRRLDASAPSLPSPGGAPFASQQPVRMPPTPMEMPGSPASSRPSSVHSVEYKPSQRGARTPAGMSPRVEQPPTPKSSSSWWGGLVKKAQTFIDPVSEDEHNEHRGQAYGHARQPSGAQQHFGAQQQYGAQQHFGAQQQFGRPMAQTPPPPLHKPQAHDQLGPPRREAQRPASVPPSPAPAIPPAPATVADAPPPAAPATPATPSAALAPTAVTSPAPTEQKKVDAPASSPPDDKQPEKEEEQVQEVQAPPQEELAKPPHQPEKEQKESPVTQEAKADEQPSKPSLPPLDTSGGAGPAAEAQDDDDDNVPLATKVASSVPKRLQEGDDTEGTSEAEPASSRPTSPEVDKAQGGLTKNQKKNQRKKGKKGGK